MASETEPDSDRFITLRAVSSFESQPTRAAALDEAKAAPSRPSSPVDAAKERQLEGTRYDRVKTLGEGGMGVVELHQDRWLGRDVAMKISHPLGPDVDAQARFLREIRVQGQLEHPGVVPVYDLGAHPGGEIFFTMKRVRGKTLEAILREVGADDDGARQSFPRRRLLAALASVAMVVAYAHSRGVIHRDLKPANIILGDYGEVYVLDWGVAKLLADEEGPAPPSADPEKPAIGGGPLRADRPAGRTEAGALLGTPGYMAPEQARGDVESVDERTDVYALGIMLFEILTLEPAFAAPTVGALLAETMSASAFVPSERAPSSAIPVELDELCRNATTPEHGRRLSNARLFHAGLAAHLDGEQDVLRRRELAKKHLRAARTALRRPADSAEAAHTQRARATRELGLALALNPNDKDALVVLTQLVLDAPDALPPHAEAELAEINRKDRVRGTKAGALIYALVVISSPVIALLGINHYPAFLIWVGVNLALAAYTGWMSFTGNAGPRFMVFLIPIAFAGVAAFSTVFGPLVLAPGFAAVAAVTLLTTLRPNRPTRQFILGCSVASVLLPLLLSVARLAPMPYAIESGAIVVSPTMMRFPEGGTLLAFSAVAIGIPILANLLAGRAVKQLMEAERKAFSQAWRLRQLLPADAELESRGSERPPDDTDAQDEAP